MFLLRQMFRCQSGSTNVASSTDAVGGWRVAELLSAARSHVPELIGNVLVGACLLSTKELMYSLVQLQGSGPSRAGVVFDAVRRYTLDPSFTIALSIS